MGGCRVGLLGFGTVGSAVARRLTLDPATSSNLALTHIFDRRASLKRDTFPSGVRLKPDLSDRVRLKADTTEETVRLKADTTKEMVRLKADTTKIVWSERVDDVLTSDVDIVIEAIGGVGDALEWTRAALMAGKSVVTCNKQLVAAHGPELLDLAARQGRQLRFEAAVGGAMPIVRAIGDGLAGDRLTRIVAILNGTTNAVLSSMEASGCSMERALADARARGYAEADPSADLDGLDARAKLAILCALAFGIRVEASEIATRSAAGLTATDFAAARRGGETIRQIAHASFDAASRELTAWVGPTRVTAHSVFGQAAGPRNAAVISGTFAGEIAISGAGAGGDATAVAVISDLLAIARDRAAIVPAPRLGRPAKVIGFTTDSAGRAGHAKHDDLCALRELGADRRLVEVV